MTLLHFPSILFPPRRRRPFRTYIITVLPQPRVPSCVPRVPSPRLFLRNNLRQERRIMGHDCFQLNLVHRTRFPFTGSEFAANLAIHRRSFFVSCFFNCHKFLNCRNKHMLWHSKHVKCVLTKGQLNYMLNSNK